jgi:hypothetical protein
VSGWGLAVALLWAGRLPASQEAGRADFLQVARVLQSPRCQNCHPRGDRPLRGDQGAPHAMNVSRRSEAAGLTCAACHRAQNGAAPHSPPGVAGWRMPSAETPMIFEGRTPAELCAQLKDRRATGGRSLSDLLEHLRGDPLVLWAYHPGPGRTLPPLAHAELVASFQRWLQAGTPCPGP